MAAANVSGKRLLIDKANTTVVIVVGVSCFLTILALMSSNTLWKKHSYQSRVIKQKSIADKQLIADVDAADKLNSAYKAFVDTPVNIIGGSSTNTGDRDGDNAKIVLDALPSKYDFPALATSLEKLLTDPAYKITSISGKDDEVAQQGTQPTNAPQAVEVPFQISVSGGYDAMQGLLQKLEASIRPMQVQTLELTAQGGSIQMAISANTYYQPEKHFQITTQEIR